ncbi:hypothetical protein WJX77_001403 [Trebouxia sp. C0004]
MGQFEELREQFRKADERFSRADQEQKQLRQSVETLQENVEVLEINLQYTKTIPTKSYCDLGVFETKHVPPQSPRRPVSVADWHLMS